MAEQPSRSQKLHERLARIIAETPPGERLLTEPELARQLGVSRATLREAMRTFETQGMIRRRQGSGTYVVHPAHVIETGLEVLESIETLAHRIDLEVFTGEVRIDHRQSTPEEAVALAIEPGANVAYISRVIMAEERPVAFLIDILPEGILTQQELAHEFTGSVFDMLMRHAQPQLAYSRTEINATTASAEVARSLGIQRGDVLLRFTAYLHDIEDRIVDYSFSYFLPGYFHFHVIRRVEMGLP